MFLRIVKEEGPIAESVENGFRFAFQQRVRLVNTMVTHMLECWGTAWKDLGEVLKMSMIHGALGMERGREVRRSRVALKCDKINRGCRRSPP